MITIEVSLAQILAKQELKDFDGMLRIFRELDENRCNLPIRFAVLKARTIQVAENSQGYELCDVESCLLDAIKTIPMPI